MLTWLCDSAIFIINLCCSFLNKLTALMQSAFLYKFLCLLRVFSRMYITDISMCTNKLLHVANIIPPLLCWSLIVCMQFSWHRTSCYISIKNYIFNNTFYIVFIQNAFKLNYDVLLSTYFWLKQLNISIVTFVALFQNCSLCLTSQRDLSVFFIVCGYPQYIFFHFCLKCLILFFLILVKYT